MPRRPDPTRTWHAWVLLKASLNQTTKAVDLAFASEVDQLESALLPRLEAHRSARGDVQSHAMRGSTVEAQRGVGLGEVVVRAHLDRPVAGVLDDDRRRAAARVQDEIGAVGQQFAGDHAPPLMQWVGARSPAWCHPE